MSVVAPQGDVSAPGVTESISVTVARLRRLALVAGLLHLVARCLFVAQGRFLASEDDAYRLYLAHLLTQDVGRIIGRIWLPGQRVLLVPLLELGVPPVWAGVLLSTLGLAALVLAVYRVTLLLAGPAAGWAVVTVMLASPLGMTIAHSSLADGLAAAFLALAAWGFIVRAQGGRLSALAWGSGALCAAALFRYEAWFLGLFYVIAAMILGVRKRGNVVGALADGLVASIWAVAPLSWMIAQAASWGHPLAFVKEVQAITDVHDFYPSRLGMLARRAGDLLAFAPAAIALAALGALSARRAATERVHPWMWAFLAWCSVAVLPPFIDGHEHPVFPARFVYSVEIGLAPLAALGLVSVVQGKLGHFAQLAIPVLVLAALSIGVVRPPALQDTASLAVGQELRNGVHDGALGGRAILIERMPVRPPFGWATVGVLWNEWDRTVWIERENKVWTVVEARDAKNERRLVPQGQLATYLTERNLGAVWAQSTTLETEVALARPDAQLHVFEPGILFLLPAR